MIHVTCDACGAPIDNFEKATIAQFDSVGAHATAILCASCAERIASNALYSSKHNATELSINDETAIKKLARKYIESELKVRM